MIFRTLIISGTLIIASFAGCTVHQNAMIAQGIRGGADPIAVRCAYTMSQEKGVCILRARETE